MPSRSGPGSPRQAPATHEECGRHIRHCRPLGLQGKARISLPHRPFRHECAPARAVIPRLSRKRTGSHVHENNWHSDILLYFRPVNLPAKQQIQTAVSSRIAKCFAPSGIAGLTQTPAIPPAPSQSPPPDIHNSPACQPGTRCSFACRSARAHSG